MSPRGATNAVYLIGEKVISLGSIAAANVIILRALGPEVYGGFGAATAVLSMCMPLTLFGSVMIVRTASQRGKMTRGLLVLATQLSFVGALVGAAFMCVLGFLGLMGQPASTLLLILLVALLARPLTAVDVWFQSESLNPSSTRIRTAVTVLSAAARSAAALTTDSLFVLAFIIVAENIVAGLWLRAEQRRLSRRFEHPLSRSPLGFMRREVVTSSVTYLIYAMSVILFMRIDQPILLILAGSEAVGVYAAAANLSDSLSFIPNALLTAALPILLKLAPIDQLRFRQGSAVLVRAGAGAGYLMAAGGLIVAPWLVSTLYGGQYSDSVLLLQVLLAGVPFLFVGLMRTPQLLFDNLQREMMWIGLVALVTNIVLNVLLIPTLGALGAAVSTTLCHLINSVFGNLLFPRTRYLFKVQAKALLPHVALSALWSVARTRRLY